MSLAPTDCEDPLAHRYIRVMRLAGRSLADAYLLVHRAPSTDFADDEGTETLVVRLDGGPPRVVASCEGAARDLVVSPSGTVYVAGALDGRHGLHIGTPTGDALRWHRAELPADAARVEGVWALDDHTVFAWGGGSFLRPGDEPTGERARLDPPWCAFFDGHVWRSVPSPGPITAVHGASADTIMAVGRGLVAHWRGDRWNRMEPPGDDTASFVFGAGDTVRAASFQGILWEGTVYGWNRLARGPHAIVGLAHWRGAWIVAAAHTGLLRSVGDTFERVVAAQGVGCLHAGDTLCWSGVSGLVETTDFTTFHELRDTVFERALGGSWWSD